MKTDKILRYATLTGIFLIPFIPLIVSSSLFFPFITGKNFSFRVIVEIITGLWLILALRDSAYRPKKSLILWAIAIFVFIIGLADIFSANPYKSFWSNFERMEGWVTIFHLFLYFVVAGTMLSTIKLWTRFIQVSIAVSIIEAFYGILQLAGKIVINQGGVRLDGTFGNATYLAVYMLFHIGLTVFLLLRERFSRTWQWIYGIVALLQAYILYHTATRGVTLGLLVAIFIALVLIALFEKERPAMRKWSRIGLIAVIVLVAAFFGLRRAPFITNNPSLERIASITLNEATARFGIWKMAIKGFEERPILGWGQESFNFVFNKYYDPSLYTQEQWFDRSHDIIFDWLIAGGILGLLSYLSLFAALLIALWKDELSKLRFMSRLRLSRCLADEKSGLSISEKAVLTGLLGGYFFQNIFVFDNIGSYIMFFSMLALIHALTAKPVSARAEKVMSFGASTVNRVLVPLVIVVCLFAVYFFNYRAYMANKTLIAALSNPDPNARYGLFVQALSYHSFGDPEIREQLIQTALDVGGSSLPIDVKQKYFDLAQSEMLKQIAGDPGDARYELFLGSFLSRFGRYDDALVHLNKALSESPHKQTISFEIGAALLAQGKYDQALAALKQAYDEAPSYSTARDLYAVAAIYDNKPDLVSQLLVPAYGSVLVPTDQFIKAYYDTKQPDKVLAIWKIRVQANPTNAQYYLGLAAAYLGVSDRPSAIAAIQKAVSLDPTLKAQGDSYISQIQAGKNP